MTSVLTWSLALLVFLVSSANALPGTSTALLDPDWVAGALRLPCVANSSQPACATFTYPIHYADQDLASLCAQSPIVPTCTLLAACASKPATTPISTNIQRWCAPVRLLATACRLDGMAHLPGCSGYSSLCGPGSSVRQCSDHSALALLPTAETTDGLVRTICDTTSLASCRGCPDMRKRQTPLKWGATRPPCDLLTVYAQLCVEAPAMAQCAAFAALCSSDPSLYLCRGSLAHRLHLPSPAMLMYFNAQQPFHLLFGDWTPGGATSGGLLSLYRAAWWAIFALGVTLELLQVLKCRLEVVWERRSFERSFRRRARPAWWMDKSRVRRAMARVPLLAYRLHWEDAGRAATTLATTAAAYLLMLAAMSYNTGIFFAAVLGVASGSLLFGRYRHTLPSNISSSSSSSITKAPATNAAQLPRYDHHGRPRPPRTRATWLGRLPRPLAALLSRVGLRLVEVVGPRVSSHAMALCTMFIGVMILVAVIIVLCISAHP